MLPRFPGRVVVIPQAIGFLVLAALVWMDELLDLPHVLFGAPASPHRVAEALLESVVVVRLPCGRLRKVPTAPSVSAKAM